MYTDGKRKTKIKISNLRFVYKNIPSVIINLEEKEVDF